MMLQCAQVSMSTNLRLGIMTTHPKATALNSSPSPSSSHVGLQCSNININMMYVEVRISSCHFNNKRMRMRHNVSSQQWMRRDITVCAQASTGQEQQPKQPKPTFVQLIPITGEAQFDEVLESDKPVIIDWCLLLFLPFASLFQPSVGCVQMTLLSNRSIIIIHHCKTMQYMLYHEMPEYRH